jgi:cytidylate kinase
MGEAMARALRHWQTRGKGETVEPVAPTLAPTPAPPPLSIAISRQAGANGSAIAGAVGQRLGWPVYDKELIEKIAQELGLRTQLIESVDERRVSWLEECFRSFTPQRQVSKEEYTQHLTRVLLSLAAHGECVIVGRGSAQLLPEATTLRVRLIGPLAARVAAIQKRMGFSAEEAKRWVETTEKQRTQFICDHFHKDANDPTLYDLILNTGRLTVEDCAELIVVSLTQLKEGKARRKQ